MRARDVKQACLALSALTLVACGEPPPAAPSAVIRACPAAVCVGDDFATWIHLDAKKSSSRLRLVYEPPKPGEAPLQFSWSFAGSKHQLDAGELDGEDIVVSFAADRP